MKKLILIVLALTSCNGKMTAKKNASKLPIINAFITKFNVERYTVVYHDMDEKRAWDGKFILYGRYLINFRVPVNKSGTKISSPDKIMLKLMEIKSVNKEGHTKYTEFQIELTKDQIDYVIENGSFDGLGLKLIKDKSIKNNEKILNPSWD